MLPLPVVAGAVQAHQGENREHRAAIIFKAFPDEVVFEKGLKEVSELVLWICGEESS